MLLAGVIMALLDDVNEELFLIEDDETDKLGEELVGVLELAMTSL